MFGRFSWELLKQALGWYVVALSFSPGFGSIGMVVVMKFMFLTTFHSTCFITMMSRNSALAKQLETDLISTWRFLKRKLTLFIWIQRSLAMRGWAQGSYRRERYAATSSIHTVFYVTNNTNFFNVHSECLL